ncbi:ribonuclease HII [Geoalkalibacter halelectricus]|uniref:Ribonuclease HII n=1 Tax=Geoalkalibacter halelectricus TaxID=2847045 RepID=A0ABY5ZPR9_9BACT|nr:ribonuclease HII [Geoalkalibacter halelectricus]MDO3378814.1 ribonuclease HII [Geoalkalibacter halelectricus]UWZ79880.1 ribonuclease HII [Geoalkalibacter halelectricus]
MEELRLFPEQELSLCHFEKLAQRRGFRAVAGVDEAGRGPLAGPVVAAAVILPPDFALDGLTDSKKLSDPQRRAFYPLIRAQALAVGVGTASAAEIDQHNILQATLRAMQRAVARLAVPADYLLIDGITPLPTAIAQQTLKQGDSRSLSVAAASVVAKVVRDRIMASLDRSYPGYGLAGHKGYGSRAHLEAIARLGPSPQHRRSFRGVREHVGAP